MRLLLATAVLLLSVTAHAACVDGVCVPWLDLPDPVRVGVRVIGATPAGGVLTVRRMEDGRRWTLPATAAEMAGVRALMLPAGAYAVTVELERHRPATRNLEVRAATPFEFGAIRVLRMPRIEGEVRREDGKPLAGARVALHPPSQAVTTSASGGFAIDVDGHWPSGVLVTHPGYGTRLVRLVPTEGDTNVPAMTLRKGTTLRLRVARGTENGPIDVKLGALSDEGPPIWIATKTLPAGRTVLTFDDLDRDVYRVLLSGREPLQRMVLSAVMNDEEKTIDVKLPDTRLRGIVTHGGEPLPGATVELHRSGLWKSSMTTDAKGELSSTSWESTDLDALIHGATLSSSRLVQLPAGKGLNIDLPARALRGTIVDGSGKPVPHARIALRGQQENVQASVRTESDDEGRYAFSGLDAGSFELHADAPGYLRIDPIFLELDEATTVAERRIVLDTAYSRPLEIADREGRPAAGAAVVCAIDGRIKAAAITDLDGRASIATPAGTSVLFVIPREGSLAVLRLKPALDDATLVHRIVIPPGESKLDITALAGEAPLTGVSLLMRFNGELFTPQIARELRMWHRSSLRTGEDGRATLTQIPAGYYEFWPYQSDEEAAMLIESSTASAAPIALHVVRGENQVKVRFDKTD